MANELSLSQIFKSTIILFGNSGAGKGVFVDEMSEVCREAGFVMSGYASGNGFRGLFSIKNPTPDVKEALELMKQGKQAEGIWPIAESATEAMKGHIRALARGEKSIFYEDGMWRNGEDVGVLNHGQRLPSQGLQLAGMWHKAIKDLIDSGELLLNKEETMLIQMTPEQDLKKIDHDNFGITKIYGYQKNEAHHVIVHVDEETAGRLMRIRSFLELSKAVGIIATDKRTGKLVDAVRESISSLYLLQSGNFKVRSGKVLISLKDINDETKAFKAILPENQKLVDIEVRRVCKAGLDALLGTDVSNDIQENDLVTRYVKELKNFGVVTELRADDLVSDVRDTRVGGYLRNVEGSVYPEIGARVDSQSDCATLVTEPRRENITFVQNKVDDQNPGEGFIRYVNAVKKEAKVIINSLKPQDEVNRELSTERRKI